LAGTLIERLGNRLDLCGGQCCGTSAPPTALRRRGKPALTRSRISDLSDFANALQVWETSGYRNTGNEVLRRISTMPPGAFQ